MGTKIWNASGTNRMILGRLVKPGRCVVTEEPINRLHKLKTGIESRSVVIGKDSPYGKPPRAVADARYVDSSGSVEGPHRIVPKHAHGSVESVSGEKVDKPAVEESKSLEVADSIVVLDEAVASSEHPFVDHSHFKKRTRRVE